MSDMRSLRKTFKEFDTELRKSRQEATKAFAMTFGALYSCTFTIASIKLTDGALLLLGNKLSKIGTVLAHEAELKAIEKGRTSIDKKTMKSILDELEKKAKEFGEKQ